MNKVVGTKTYEGKENTSPNPIKVGKKLIKSNDIVVSHKKEINYDRRNELTEFLKLFTNLTMDENEILSGVDVKIISQQKVFDNYENILDHLLEDTLYKCNINDAVIVTQSMDRKEIIISLKLHLSLCNNMIPINLTIVEFLVVVLNETNICEENQYNIIFDLSFLPNFLSLENRKFNNYYLDNFKNLQEKNLNFKDEVNKRLIVSFSYYNTDQV